jgi:DNA oxidative demethylase
MNLDLFASDHPDPEAPVAPTLCEGVFVLRGFALSKVQPLLTQITQICALAPARSMRTPGGLPMSVATSSCGSAGWVSDAYGYRYAKRNGNAQWPAMPDDFFVLAQTAAQSAGFANFMPDSCLINVYRPGAKMSLHQDKNERDFSQPIVSVSLGLPAIFLMGGTRREHKTQRILLNHGDVVVWGGPARMNFHGVLPIKPGTHPLLGQQRINLTFRKAL